MTIFQGLSYLFGLGSKRSRYLIVQEKIDAGIMQFLGGDGSSMDNAILIAGDIQRRNEGIAAEFIYLSMKLGERDKDWILSMQSLVCGEDGTHYDKMNVEDLKTHATSSYYFNISEFFGK